MKNRPLRSALVALSLLILGGCGPWLTHDRCIETYNGCLDTCASRCNEPEPLGPAHLGEEDDKIYTACQECLKNCRQQAERCEDRESAAQDGSGG